MSKTFKDNRFVRPKWLRSREPRPRIEDSLREIILEEEDGDTNLMGSLKDEAV